jgi:RNA polymerase sigma-70 factor (ECF subfamily)
MEGTMGAISIKTEKKETQIKYFPTGLVDNYGDAVYRFCRSLTYSKEDAEDLFQETFIKAFEQLPKINASDNPKNFLFSIALYLWKSWKRKYARRNRLIPIQPLDDGLASDAVTEDHVLSQESTRIVRELVHTLPEKLKIPIILYYTVEMNLSDIATTLKLPVGTIKSRLYKARKLIEKGLVEIGYEE